MKPNVDPNDLPEDGGVTIQKGGGGGLEPLFWLLPLVILLVVLL